MTVRTLGRRQFLLGGSSFALALPWLGSLFPRPAAGEPPYSPAPRLAALVTPHGGVWGSQLYPADATLGQSSTLYPGHSIRSGALVRTEASAIASLSATLAAPAAALTSGLAAKLNVLRGLDIMFAAGHNDGMALGNLGACGVAAAQAGATASVDQVLAWAPSFYGPATGIRERVMVVSDWQGHSASHGHTSAATQTGPVVPVAAAGDSLALFDRVFGQLGAPTAAPRQPVVDKIHDSYRRLRDGAFGDARRLSAADRLRLDEHMQRLAELERSLTTAQVSCAGLTRPTATSQTWASHTRDATAAARFYQQYNEVIALAFRCGASRLASVLAYTPFVAHSVDWHEGVAHLADVNAASHTLLESGHRNFFSSVFVDLCQRLDTEEANGVTYLDNSLVLWTSESGDVTHHNFSMPVVTAGSAAGYLNTGRYVDYRNLSNLTAADARHPVRAERRPGLPYNRLLATVLRAFGLAPSAFERNGQRGYGSTYTESRFAGCWSAAALNDNSEPLPLMRRAP